MSIPSSPFETIESAQDFLRVLAETVNEARQEIAVDLERELQSPPSRRTKALQIAAYNLDKLEKQMMRSLRTLNDLRSLRRLLFGEREFYRVRSLSTAATVTQKPERIPTIITAIPAPGKIGTAPVVNVAPSRSAVPA